MSARAIDGTNTAAMVARARLLAQHGGVAKAVASREWPAQVTVCLAEGLVLGLLKQGIRKYLAIFGHGSTALAEVLRVYEAEGLVRTWNFRHEVEMSHAATALSWQYGEVPAVVTSIGPGALQAMAGSLAAAANGVGVYHLYGDETTHREGYNMQQLPRAEQGSYGRLLSAMGKSFVLHTPEALRDALRQGALTVFDAVKAAPYYLLLPINTQPAPLLLNLDALPVRPRPQPQVGTDREAFAEAAALLRAHDRIVIKAGGGTRRHATGLRELAEATGAAVVLSPGSVGVLPDAHPQNMHVGGSKGSLSGNFAMSEGRLLVVLGSRAVCQADCSGIGYPRVEAVININQDRDDLFHYNRTTALRGDITATIRRLLEDLGPRPDGEGRRRWLAECAGRKGEWKAFQRARAAAGPRPDAAWGEPVLTQPAAIAAVAAFAKERGAVKLFDAGDVQANGFQLVEDDQPFETFTESGASYMGFAANAVLAGALAERPSYPIAFSGDGSFLMNPQVLLDAVEHRARGMIVVFDNRRMAAITGLQLAQYGQEYRTNDSVAVDYAAMASAVRGVLGVWAGTTRASLRQALERAHAHPGLSLVHVPVYCGDDPEGGMGAYGDWNVGNWCERVQALYHRQSL
ncbi:MAG TPA: thiamine pyrophosphate-dependent enzyme [Anaeromyxobacter sp.]|nr:thiamine pyrophosphate-dependent enzyme [Anaeromyxobacter sp.]